MKTRDELAAYVKQLAAENQHIAAHAVLEHVFAAVWFSAPRLIVEIGTGVNGLRTKAVCRTGAAFNARHVSCDIRDCSGCGNSWNPLWTFIQMDGRELAKQWNSNASEDKIDVLVIDTDEHYETTKQVWEAWLPHLSPSAVVLFRCSNLQKTLFYKNGTTTEKGWDNQRGVARVIEEILGHAITETVECNYDDKDWSVQHWPWGAGLTVLRRRP